MTVTPVNDAPSFVKGADQTVAEDAALQTVTAGPRRSTSARPMKRRRLTFTATSGNPGLFMDQPAVAPDGTLTYRPAANANGSSTVTVYVKDNGGTANGGVDTSATQIVQHHGHGGERRAGRQRSDRERQPKTRRRPSR